MAPATESRKKTAGKLIPKTTAATLGHHPADTSPVDAPSGWDLGPDQLAVKLCHPDGNAGPHKGADHHSRARGIGLKGDTSASPMIAP